jgi:hypothetical protein
MKWVKYIECELVVGDNTDHGQGHHVEIRDWAQQSEFVVRENLGTFKLSLEAISRIDFEETLKYLSIMRGSFCSSYQLESGIKSHTA